MTDKSKKDPVEAAKKILDYSAEFNDLVKETDKIAKLMAANYISFTKAGFDSMCALELTKEVLRNVLSNVRRSKKHV